MVVYETITDTLSISDTPSPTPILNLQEILTLTEVLRDRGVIEKINELISVTEQLIESQQVFYSAKIKYNFNLVVGATPVKLTKFLITRNLGKVSSLKFSIYNQELPLINFGDTVRLSWIAPDGNEYLIFIGEVTTITEVEKSPVAQIDARGIEYLLERDIFMAIDDMTGEVTGVFSYTSTRADKIVADILSGTGFNLIECPTDAITVKFDFTPRWRALQVIADILNVDLWVDTNYGVHLGIKSGSYNSYDAIYKQTVTRDSSDKLNRVIIIGGVTPSGSIPVGIAQDGTDIQVNGVKCKVKKIPQIQDIETATKLAKAYLSRYSAVAQELALDLALTPVNIRLREGDIILIDGVEYKITKLTVGHKYLRAVITPSIGIPTITEYLNQQATTTEQNNISSDFESSTPGSFVIYEAIDLAPDPDGDGIVETIDINGVLYTILGIMHFYIPPEFTPEELTIYARQVSTTTDNWGISINNMIIMPVVTTGDDGKQQYEVGIPPDIIVQGWNILYFISIP